MDSLRQSLSGWFRVAERLLDGVRDESLLDELTRGRVVATVLEKIPTVLSDMVKQRIGYGGRATVPRWVSWSVLESEYMSVLDELLAEVGKGLLYRVPLLAPLGPSASHGSTAHSGCTECGSPTHLASACQRRVPSGAPALTAKGVGGGRMPSGPAGGPAGGAAAGRALAVVRVGAGDGGAAGPAKGGVVSAPRVAGAAQGATGGTRRSTAGATAGTVCYKCGAPGHYAYACTAVVCHNCKQPGHYASACTSVRSSVAVCRNCKQPGHIQKNCPAGKRSGS
jgi:cellular nucleic acid-binding protein